MKPALLLLLALLGGARRPLPPAERVLVGFLTAEAYQQARKAAPVAAEKHLFPLKKRHGVITIQTAAGSQVFRDKWSAVETERVTYDYCGYLPRVRQHLLRKSYWAGEERLVEVILAVQPDGRVLQFDSEPLYSPDQRHVALFRQVPDYDAMLNQLQVFEQRRGSLVLLWEAMPKTWQPAEVFWATDSTLYVKKNIYKRKQTVASSGVPYKPALFAYACLLVRPAR